MEFNKTVYNQFDFETIKILDGFLPEKIFDSHTHFFDKSFAPTVSSQYGVEKGDSESYNGFFEAIFGNTRQVCRNSFAFPDKALCNRDGDELNKSDMYLLKELTKNPCDVGEIIVMPKESAYHIEKRLVHPNIKGFKCYHTFNEKEITQNCDIWEYLPDGAWEIANERKMCITLHLVKDYALADENNLKYIIKMAQKFKDTTLVLAHAARSFASWTAIESVEKIKHLENVWFDFSGVCESPAMLQILKKVGVSRCMWGSDFPICTSHGKAISFADTFYWINQKDIDNFNCGEGIKNWLIAIENLMATRQACILADLSSKETMSLFYNNAACLFYGK